MTYMDFSVGENKKNNSQNKMKKPSNKFCNKTKVNLLKKPSKIYKEIV